MAVGELCCNHNKSLWTKNEMDTFKMTSNLFGGIIIIIAHRCTLDGRWKYGVLCLRIPFVYSMVLCSMVLGLSRFNFFGVVELSSNEILRMDNKIKDSTSMYILYAYRMRNKRTKCSYFVIKYIFLKNSISHNA